MLSLWLIPVWTLTLIGLTLFAEAQCHTDTHKQTTFQGGMILAFAPVLLGILSVIAPVLIIMAILWTLSRFLPQTLDNLLSPLTNKPTEPTKSPQDHPLTRGFSEPLRPRSPHLPQHMKTR